MRGAYNQGLKWSVAMVLKIGPLQDPNVSSGAFTSLSDFEGSHGDSLVLNC